MTISDGKPRVKGDAEDSILPLDDGDIYVRQDGPRGAAVGAAQRDDASGVRHDPGDAPH